MRTCACGCVALRVPLIRMCLRVCVCVCGVCAVPSDGWMMDGGIGDGVYLPTTLPCSLFADTSLSRGTLGVKTPNVARTPGAPAVPAYDGLFKEFLPYCRKW
ncbi:hypothetical protein BX600DRAFT_473827 [Xylariales sp. PMI_506]|nr:hypothetical protein BX600DRAFT_473827 [Xylariales sp. PMI_506]